MALLQSGAGATAGAGAGELGRSKLLDLLAPLDYPRQALWNLLRGAGKLVSGEGSADDLLGALPGAIGAGVAAFNPLGLLGGALAGGAAQGLGKLTDSPAFEANTPGDLVESLGGDRDSFLQNALVGIPTDPLTYAGGWLGRGKPARPASAVEAAPAAVAEAAPAGEAFTSEIYRPYKLSPGQPALHHQSVEQRAAYLKAQSDAESAAYMAAHLPPEVPTTSLVRPTRLDFPPVEPAGTPATPGGLGEELGAFNAKLEELTPLQRKSSLAGDAQSYWENRRAYFQNQLDWYGQHMTIQEREAALAAARNAEYRSLSAQYGQQEAERTILAGGARDVAPLHPFSATAQHLPQLANDRWGVLSDYFGDHLAGQLEQPARFADNFYSMLQDALGKEQAAVRLGPGVANRALPAQEFERLAQQLIRDTAEPGVQSPFLYNSPRTFAHDFRLHGGIYPGHQAADLLNARGLAPRSFAERSALARLLERAGEYWKLPGSSLTEV